MYYEISDFLPIPFTVHYALQSSYMRPWLRYKYCKFFHDLDLYEIGYC